MRLAAVLLLVWASVHYLYALAPSEQQGAVFNVLRSAGSLVLLGALFIAVPSRAAAPIVAGLAAEEAQVVGCGVWWLIDPWPATGELCSEALGLPMGAFGLTALGVAAFWLRNKMRGNHAGPGA